MRIFVSSWLRGFVASWLIPDFGPQPHFRLPLANRERRVVKSSHPRIMACPRCGNVDPPVHGHCPGCGAPRTTDSSVASIPDSHDGTDETRFSARPLENSTGPLGSSVTAGVTEPVAALTRGPEPVT